MTTIIRKLQPDELREFHQLLGLFSDVFELEAPEIPTDHDLHQLLSRPDFCVFAALKDGNVLGGLTAFLLPQYLSLQPVAYIYDLGVAVECQRQGIGKKLVQEFLSFCREKQCHEVFVQAEGDDEAAIAFYEATGGDAEMVVHFTYLGGKHPGNPF